MIYVYAGRETFNLQFLGNKTLLLYCHKIYICCPCIKMTHNYCSVGVCLNVYFYQLLHAVHNVYCHTRQGHVNIYYLFHIANHLL